MNLRTAITVTVTSVLTLGAAMLGAQQTEGTVTGTVGDAACGVQHRTNDATACTLACVREGSDYALIAGDTVYTLTGLTDETRAQLEERAGKMAAIRGRLGLEEGTFEVISVTAAE